MDFRKGRPSARGASSSRPRPSEVSRKPEPEPEPSRHSARAAEGNPPSAEASDPGAAVITVSENAAANAAPPFLADRVAALSARRLRASAL